MFVRSRAAAALERKKELFSSYARNRRRRDRRVCSGWLGELKAESAASLNDRLNAIDDPWPGALPTAEFD